MGAALGSPLADSLGAGVVAPALADAPDPPEEPERPEEEDDGDGAAEVAVPSPDFESDEPEEPDGSEESDAFEVVVSPVTAPLTVVPEPPLKLPPETSS
ncbi:hypothetical protein [Streptomyces sp. NPDC048277]|uniref:hypothetical protein n=1 Tax=Streptomyces sp. NPDC048277 TaxID=3155027 RepID=UPI0033C39F62